MLDEAAESFESVRDSFPDNPTFTYYAARIAEKRGHPEIAARWYRGILRALDILRPTYRCSGCETELDTFVDRCPRCARWGSVSLDIGVRPLHEPLPAARPVYAVRGEESSPAPPRSKEESEAHA